jgi:hypothetical protein
VGFCRLGPRMNQRLWRQPVKIEHGSLARHISALLTTPAGA